MNKILVTDYFDSTWFVNRSGMALTTSIQGFYLQPRKKLGDHEWKLDVWLVREDQYKAYTAFRGKVDDRRMYELVLDNPEKTFEELLPLAEALA